MENGFKIMLLSLVPPVNPIRLSSVHLFFGNMLLGNRNLPNEGGGHEPDKLH